LPGLTLSAIYLVYILARAYFQPGLAPALSIEEREAVPVSKRLTMCAISVVPPIILIFGVLGTIILGMATPTEAAGVGAFITFLMTFAYRRFSWQGFREAVINTARTTSMVLIIAIGAGCFSSAFLMSGGGKVITNLILGLELGKWGAFVVMMACIFLLGCFIDWIGIIFIAFPIFLPLASKLGFDPLWFVVIIAVLLQTCFLTPPFGYALFYLKGIVPEGVDMGHVYRGVIPFVIMQIVAVALCAVFPNLILWLPAVLVK
jgi:tripartite ATP-independent transporter DctM subunit